MQYDFNQTARSIATIFFAAKIYKALDKYVAKKESYVTDEYISLEDYLFDDYEFVNVNRNQIENLIVIDHTGNILNLAGSKQITESEIIPFKDKSNAIARVDFNIDINNTKQITNIVAGIPQIIEVTGQTASKDITIKEGATANEAEVYDSQTGNLIARIKLLITEKIKQLIKTIFEKIKKIFANDTIRKPFAYIVGLISSFVIMPIYNRIKNFFKSKHENILYFEDTKSDKPIKLDDVIDSSKTDSEKTDKEKTEETNRINKIVNKILALTSGLFKGVNKVLRLFVQFIVALLENSKALVINLLLGIIQMFYALRGLFIIFLTLIAGALIGTTKLVGIGIEELGEKRNIKTLINFAQGLQKATDAVLEKLETIVLKEGGMKSATEQLKVIFYKARKLVEQSINAFNNAIYNPTEENKKKLRKILEKLVKDGIIKPIEKSVFLVANAAILTKNKSLESGFQQLSDVVIRYLNYLIAVKVSSRVINEFLQHSDLRTIFNQTVNSQIKTLNAYILELRLQAKEIDTYNNVIPQLEKIKENLIKLRIG